MARHFGHQIIICCYIESHTLIRSPDIGICIHLIDIGMCHIHLRIDEFVGAVRRGEPVDHQVVDDVDLLHDAQHGGFVGHLELLFQLGLELGSTRSATHTKDTHVGGD